MEFDKKCRVSLSPNTVLPPIPPSPRVEKRSSKGRLRRKDELLIIEDNDFTEIRFSRFRSVSCKNESLRPLELGNGMELRQQRRGSVYQTSGEVRCKKQLGSEDVRSKIEISHSMDKYVSVRNVDSPCSGTCISPLNTYQIKPNGDPCSLDDIVRNKLVMSSTVKLSMQGEHLGDPNGGFEHVAGSLGDVKCSLEKDVRRSLHKSVSAKVETRQPPRQSSGDSHKTSPKSRFRPIRKIMDPFMKSKSHKSPLGCGLEFSDARRTETVHACSGITRDSLLSNIADIAPHKSFDADSHYAEKDACLLAKACLPTDLQACLKLKNINGVPVFEFSVKSPEDIFTAKTWKTENADSWVYTFHTKYGRKHSNASARGSKVCDNIDATIVGQMQVSSYLHLEYGDRDNDVGDTLTTEFVLYDIAHANRCIPTQETSLSTFRVSKGPVGSTVEENLNSDNNLVGEEKWVPKLKNASDLSLCNPNSYPWAPAYLQPSFEVAAIVIRVPFEKRESLKHGKAESIKETGYKHEKAAFVSQFQQVLWSPKINVIASTGNHSLPEAESQGPSPLLSRWRLGGGCECGGWDMTCPLTVFNNSADLHKGSHLPFMVKNIPTELFVQGLKEDVPAFSMTTVEEGHYMVNFHARLSGLQAFSICIAMLHSSETSPATGNIRNMSASQSNTLKMFLEGDVEFLIEPGGDISQKKIVTSPQTKDMKTKATVTKKETSHFSFNPPPFSPISRA